MPVKETEYDSSYSSDEETESEEEKVCPEFFSNQEFLTKPEKESSSFMKEGRMQIEGGSHYTQRKNVYNDFVEDLMEHSIEDIGMEEYVNKMESELRVIKDSKSRDGSQLKAL